MKKIIASLLGTTIVVVIIISIIVIVSNYCIQKEKHHNSTIKLFKVELQIQSIPSKDTTIYVFANDKYNAERIIDETYFEEDDTISIKEDFQIIQPINN